MTGTVTWMSYTRDIMTGTLTWMSHSRDFMTGTLTWMSHTRDFKTGTVKWITHVSIIFRLSASCSLFYGIQNFTLVMSNGLCFNCLSLNPPPPGA